MRSESTTLEPGCDPRAVLGVTPEAGPEEIRAAYLRKVREFPPDRAREQFERVRDAYALLTDPRRRARLVLEGPSPLAPLASLLEGRSGERRHVGLEPWLAVLKKPRVR